MCKGAVAPEKATRILSRLLRPNDNLRLINQNLAVLDLYGDAHLMRSAIILQCLPIVSLLVLRVNQGEYKRLIYVSYSLPSHAYSSILVMTYVSC